MGKASSVQDLADKLKAILADPEMLAKLAEYELYSGGAVSESLDELENNVAELQKLYPPSE